MNQPTFGKRKASVQTSASKTKANNFLMIVGVFICGRLLEKSLSGQLTAATTAKQASSSTPFATGCGPSGTGTSQNALIGVRYSVRLRTSPTLDGMDIINEKATNILGSTIYQEIAGSETLRELCRFGAWSQVAVVEPEYLKDVGGWVPNDALRNFDTVNGRRVFVENDIYWDSYLSRYNKRDVLAAINKVVAVRNDCPRFNPAMVSVASGRGTPDNPVFFITCDVKDFRSYNVFFDINGNTL